MAEQRYLFKNIRTLLNEGFTDEELRNLCFYEPIFKPVYDQLSRNTGKSSIIDLLIEYADQKLQVESLLTLAKEYNPARYKEHQPYYDLNISASTINVSLWKRYLSRLASKEWKEFPNVEFIVGYQDLYSTSGLQLREEIERFVQSSFSLLVIKGHAGCGKSVFLQDLARQFAVNLLQELENISANLPGYFQNPVPLFLNLNSFSIKPGESLGREIFIRLTRSGLFDISEISRPEKLLREKGKNWLILLDAFDEVEWQNRSNVWSSIRQLVDSYPNVKVLITVRPGEFFYKLPESTRTISVAPLSFQQVIRYLEAQLIDPIPNPMVKKYDIIFEFLSSEPELWEHLRLPLFLQIAINYLSGGEVSEVYEPGNSDPSWKRPPSISPSLTGDIEPNLDDSLRIDLDQIKTLVSRELANLTKLPLERENPTSTMSRAVSNEKKVEEDPPLVEETVEASIRIGVFLDRVFHRLWKHNEKKRLAGIQIGGLDETYEALGEMAANMAERQVLRIRDAKNFVNDGLYWILDLGILLKQSVWILFPTVLSKTYFAAFFLTVSLESNPSELSNLIRGSPTFWEKCLFFVKDLTSTDVKPLAKQIEALKGEQNNV